MKKFFAIAVLAIAFTACNGEAEKKADDTMETIDSTANAAKDSINTMVDDASKTIDSAANAAVDSVKSKM